MDKDAAAPPWLGTIFRSMWPKVSDDVSRDFMAELGVVLQKAIPEPFSRADFGSFRFGSEPPEVWGVDARQVADDHLMVDANIICDSDVEMRVDDKFSIKRLFMKGRVCVSVKPFKSAFPLVGTIRLFFRESPQLSFTYSGESTYPGVDKKFEAVVRDFVRTRLVFPHVWSVSSNGSGKMGVEKCTDAFGNKLPLGLLRVRVLRARNLPGGNWTVASSAADGWTSDPYCVLKLGETSFKTSTVRRNAKDPEWPDDEPWADFVILDENLKLEITVYDKDDSVVPTKFLSLLGTFSSMTVRQLIWQKAEGEDHRGRIMEHKGLRLDTSGANTTMLHVNDPLVTGVPSEIDLGIQWLQAVADLGEDPGADDRDDLASTASEPPEGLLLMELHGGTAFPADCVAEGAAGVRWRCRVGSGFGQSCTSSPGERKKQEVPGFEDSNIPTQFRVVVDRLAEKGQSDAEIAQITDLAEEAIGKYRTAKANFKEEPETPPDDGPVEVRWQKALPLLVRKLDADPRVTVELVETTPSEGRPVVAGELQSVSVKDVVVAKDGVWPMVSLPVKEEKAMASQRKSAWFKLQSYIPLCAASEGNAGSRRFESAAMEVSARFFHLRPLTQPCKPAKPKEGAKTEVAKGEEGTKKSPPDDVTVPVPVTARSAAVGPQLGAAGSGVVTPAPQPVAAAT